MEANEKDVNSGGISVLLSEYNAVIKEKHLRMDHRLKLVTFNIVCSGTLMALVLELKTYIILLLVPLISSLFGLLAVYQTRGISDLARHIRLEIAPRINSICGKPILIWDTVRPSGKRFGWVSLLTFRVPILASFLIPSVASLLLFGVYEGALLSLPEAPLFILDLLMLIYFTVVYIRLACLRQSVDTGSD